MIPESSRTHWSLLLEVGSGRERAWEYFYETYGPVARGLYRRLGVPESNVDDLVQQFFTTALAREFLANADPTRGRFRGYLRTAAERFLVSERRKAGREKRAPAEGVRSLEDVEHGRPVVGEPPQPPDVVFDRAWARALLSAAKKRARETLREAGKEAHYEAFVLRTEQELDWSEVASRMGAGAEQVRKWVERVRGRLARYVREEVGSTVSSEPDLAEELAYLSGLVEDE